MRLQTYGCRERQTDGQTDRQMGRQTDRQMGRQTDRWADRVIPLHPLQSLFERDVITCICRTINSFDSMSYLILLLSISYIGYPLDWPVSAKSTSRCIPLVMLKHTPVLLSTGLKPVGKYSLTLQNSVTSSLKIDITYIPTI